MVQLTELLGKKSAVKIIVFFLRHPTLQIHQHELQKKVKLAKATLIKWLKTLVHFNILKVVKFGRVKVYSLNRTSNLVRYIKILNNILLLPDITKIAVKHNIKAYLYGSSARGEDIEDSDIDILIIGKIKKEQIIRDINKIASTIGRTIKIQVFSQLEWSQVAKKDPAFYERVEKDKIEL